MKGYKRWTVILLFLFFLSGCGSEKPEKIQEENFVRGTVYRDGKLYQLNLIMAKNDRSIAGWNAAITTRKGILEIFDTSTMSGTVIELEPEQMGLKGTESNGMAQFMDAVSAQEYVFETMRYEYDESEGVSYADMGVSFFDLEGNVQSVDLLSVYQEKGFIEGPYSNVRECSYDSRGYSYVLSDAMNELYVFDREGKPVAEYKGDDREDIFSSMRSEEGELIFLIVRQEGGMSYSSLAWFDLDEGKFHTLADLGREWVKKLYGWHSLCGLSHR